MKTLLGILLSFGLIFASLPAVAQVGGLVSVPGIGEAVTHVDETGNPVLSMRVTDVDSDFQGYAEGQYPDYGYNYRAVTFELDNISGRSIIVEPGHFRVIDERGNTYGRSYFNLVDESITRFDDGIAIASEEVISVQLFFAVPAHLELAIFYWQPESSYRLMVDLGHEPSDFSAIAYGLNTPAFITDDFGNVVATIQVTDIVEEWNQHTAFGDPSAGMTYWAVHITVTNEADRPVGVSSFRFNLIDETSASNRYALVRSHDDADHEVFQSDDLMPGETLDAMIVFEVPDGNQPVALTWEEYGRSSPIIMLAERSDADAGELATPAVEATPADD